MSGYDSSDDSSLSQSDHKELDFESLIEESNSVLKRLKEEQAAQRQSSGAHGDRRDCTNESHQETAEIEEPAVSDSEGEDSKDDPFRQLITMRKRSATEPPKSSIRDTRESKRPKTETSILNTTWTPLSMETSQPSDLVDTSYLQNEFTELQASSQSNVTFCTSQAIDSSVISKKPVVHDDNEVTHSPSRDAIIDEGSDCKSNQAERDKNDPAEEFEKEIPPTFHKSSSRGSESTETYDNIGNKKKIVMINNSSLGSDLGFQESTCNILPADDDAQQHITDNDKQEKSFNDIPDIALPSNRSTKRKSTLTHLCAKNVPYRVGLSRKANITHLHSYLTKK